MCLVIAVVVVVVIILVLVVVVAVVVVFFYLFPFTGLYAWIRERALDFFYHSCTHFTIT